MGEIIDLESYRKQRRRRRVKTGAVEAGTVESGTVESGTAANLRRRNRDRIEHDRARSVDDDSAVEFLDRGRASVDPAANAKPGDKSAD